MEATATGNWCATHFRFWRLQFTLMTWPFLCLDNCIMQSVCGTADYSSPEAVMYCMAEFWMNCMHFITHMQRKTFFSTLSNQDGWNLQPICICCRISAIFTPCFREIVLRCSRVLKCVHLTQNSTIVEGSRSQQASLVKSRQYWYSTVISLPVCY